MVIRTFLSKIINFIYPPQCFLCKKILYNEDGICFDCLSKFDFVSEPRCDRCGYPFEFATKTKHNKKLLCPNCIKALPKFNKCISSVKYNDASKKILLPFKHGDKTGYAKFIAKIMSSTGTQLLEKSDFIIPVPIHISRMMKRKYNQSSLIVSFISKHSNKPALYNTLIRSKATQSQGHLSPRQRKQNVANVFIVNNPSQIIGKNIILIDDVFTSGATVNECAKALKKAGAKDINVLTFARVVK